MKVFYVFLSITLLLQCGNEVVNYLEEVKRINKIPGNPKKAIEYHTKALKEHKNSNFQEAERLWFMAVKTDPVNPRYYFNLACTTAAQGKDSIAIEYLKLVRDFGNNKYYLSILNDPDLESLRNSIIYKSFFNDIRNKSGSNWIESLIGKKLIRKCAIGSCSGGYDVNFTMILDINGKIDANGGYHTRNSTTGENPSEPAEIKRSHTLISASWSVVGDTLQIDMTFSGPTKDGKLVFKSIKQVRSYFSKECQYEPEIEQINTY